MRKMERNVSERILWLPVQYDADEVTIAFSIPSVFERKIRIRFATDHADDWGMLILPEESLHKNIYIETSSSQINMQFMEFRSERSVRLRDVQDHKPAALHYSLPGGELGSISHFLQDREQIQIVCHARMFGTDDLQEMVITANDSTLFDASLTVAKVGKRNTKASILRDIFTGDIEEAAAFFDKENGQVSFCRSARINEKNASERRFLSIPILMSENGENPVPHPAMRKLRNWVRNYQIEDSHFSADLRFHVHPGRWPNIGIGQSTGTSFDVSAQAYEALLELSDLNCDQVMISLPGIDLVWDKEHHHVNIGQYILPSSDRDGLNAHIFFDNDCAEVFCGGKVLFLLVDASDAITMESVDNTISGNIERCKIQSGRNPTIQIHTSNGEPVKGTLQVFGLREIRYSREAENELNAAENADSVLLYENERFRVLSDRIEDKTYGFPPAYAISSQLVITPNRVLEEFEWRDSKWGDMTRVINREDVWRASPAEKGYPQIVIPHPAIGAAFQIAEDTFIRCSSREFSLPGQEDMWAAGLFQGYGQGFGVWLRDSTHIALRCGNLISPETSLRTLRYAMKKGFDNGCDGPAMAVVGLWDYYLATGDLSSLLDSKMVLEQSALEMEKRYRSDFCLVEADQSTSNDAFAEPENDGFSLGSECYYMLAFEAMSRIGAFTDIPEKRIITWRNYAENMKRAIRENYWNEQQGFFTSGPKGSAAYAQGMWESSGIEAAIWDKFDIASDTQIKNVLNALDRKAMSPFGIRLFPDRPEHNHFCGPVWVVWEAGFAAAAGKQNNQALLWKLIAQQIRNAVLHKTFYEVLESDSGKSWRWPGQLWHAAGFLSMFFYGVFGMNYSEDGLTFSPCVPFELKGMQIHGIRYRKAVLNVYVHGWGVLNEIRLDDQRIEIIPTDITGMHNVHLIMSSSLLSI